MSVGPVMRSYSPIAPKALPATPVAAASTPVQAQDTGSMVFTGGGAVAGGVLGFTLLPKIFPSLFANGIMAFKPLALIAGVALLGGWLGDKIYNYMSGN